MSDTTGKAQRGAKRALGSDPAHVGTETVDYNARWCSVGCFCGLENTEMLPDRAQ